MTITEFLLDRGAEDEKRFRKWAMGGDISQTFRDRLLAECQAKRTIVKLHRPVDYSDLGMESPNACEVCGAELGMGDWEWVKDSFPCLTLRHLAAIYTDHPDYREEWKP